MTVQNPQIILNISNPHFSSELLQKSSFYSSRLFSDHFLIHRPHSGNLISLKCKCEYVKPPLKTLCVCTWSHFIHVRICVTLWTVAHWVPMSVGFSREDEFVFALFFFVFHVNFLFLTTNKRHCLQRCRHVSSWSGCLTGTCSTLWDGSTLLLGPHKILGRGLLSHL